MYYVVHIILLICSGPTCKSFYYAIGNHSVDPQRPVVSLPHIFIIYNALNFVSKYWKAGFIWLKSTITVDGARKVGVTPATMFV